jgi:plastocyanin
MAACGGGSVDTTVPAGAVGLAVTAVDTRFDAKTYTASPGDVTVAYANKGNLVHTLLIEGVDGFRVQANPEKTKTGTVSLKPGVYTIYCDIPGHRDQGMQATLTVA